MATAFLETPNFPATDDDFALLPEGVRDLLSEFSTETGRIEELLYETFRELDQCRERIRDDELNLRAERLELAEEQAARDAAQFEAERTLRESLSESERERTALELELENVRQRAAEFGDELSELKRTSAAEREIWQTEIRQLRKSIEKQAGHPPHPTDHHTEHASEVVQHKDSSKAATGHTQGAYDPVLGSVLNQFQALQKDLARRRQPKSSS